MILKKPSSFALAAVVAGCAVGALAGFVVRDLDLPTLVSFEYPREPLVLVGALLGGVIAVMPGRRFFGAAAFALALLWAAVAFTPFSGWLARGLARQEAEEPADAAFVSFAGLRPDARISEAQSRALRGAELLSRGTVKTLVVAESSLVPSGATVRDLMARLGLEGQPLVAGHADTTREEAVAVGALCRQKKWKLLLVVTSPIHSRRVCAALEKEGVTVISTPSMESRFDIEDLDTSRDRLTAFGSIIHERFGFWVYAQRGWVAGGSS